MYNSLYLLNDCFWSPIRVAVSFGQRNFLLWWAAMAAKSHNWLKC